MKKHFKRITAGLLAAAMIVPMNSVMAGTITASAYELLGETEFESKILPWATTESGNAKQEADINEGAAHITVIKPYGEEHGQWELQFRHGGLTFSKGHEYKISFRVKAKREGMALCSYIGSIDGNRRIFELDGKTNDMHIGYSYGGSWGKPVSLTNEYQEFSGIFKAPEDIEEEVYWIFSYADDASGFGGNAEEGDELWFDDMTIEDMSETSEIPPDHDLGIIGRSSSGLENNYISVNQLGYYTGLSKKAVLSDDKGAFSKDAKPITLSGSYEFEIVNVKGNNVEFTGTTGEAAADPDSGDTVCKIDFTDFNHTGEYYIRIKDTEWRSFPFRIGYDIYSDTENDMLTNALNYFYQSRSGLDIESKYITSGDSRELAHRFNRDEAVGFVRDKWSSEYPTTTEKAENFTATRIDTGGGWFTGSDFDKYMTEGGRAVWILQNMYERSLKTKNCGDKFADGSGIVSVPESGNDIPDILDECRYELDFMSKMKVQSDAKEWGDFAGLYYNDAHGVGFSARPKDYEHEYHSCYIVDPPTFAATLNFAACAAQGARLWADYDAEYANELLTAAKDAFKAYDRFRYDASEDEAQNPESFYQPEYKSETRAVAADYDVSDEVYWAASELYITEKQMGGEDAEFYLMNMMQHKNAFSFNSGESDTAGSMSLILNKELLPEDQAGKLEGSLGELTGNIFTFQRETGYNLPELSDYGYGSNADIINDLMLLAYSVDQSFDIHRLNGIADGMDYLFGNNPMSYSFVTGYGSYHVKNPSSRYWSNDTEEDLPLAPDGLLVSGPDAAIEDKYMRGLGFGEDTVPQRCYADSASAWSVNTVSASINAGFAWIVSYMQDTAGFLPKNPDFAGDVNTDGTFDLSDVVLVQKWLLGVPGTELDCWDAADFCRDNKLDVMDLCLMKKALLEKEENS